jgi:hypothetical protein
MNIEFLTELYTTPVPRGTKASWLRKRTDKVALVQDFTVSVDREIITVPTGYITDGSSIPRILWPVFTPWYTEARRASCIHDYIYSHLYKSHTRKFADKAFKAILLKDGSSKFVAYIFYRAVRLFGRGGW